LADKHSSFSNLAYKNLSFGDKVTVVISTSLDNQQIDSNHHDQKVKEPDTYEMQNMSFGQ
jgi:hypothetical protein